METVTENTPSVTGRVKWFNSKSGFGFITITEGEKAGNDIFVHHTSLNVSNDQYRYLLEGEYVELEISEVATGKHDMQAAEVKGIKGGKLMCETRHDCRLLKNAYREERAPQEEKDTSDFVPKQKRAPREAPLKKGMKSTDSEWNIVEKRNKRSVNKKTQR